MSVTDKMFDVLKRYFLSGVLVVVPFILTFIVLRFLFESVDGILQPLLHDLLGYYRAGLGLLTTLLIILLAGVLTRNLIGAKIFSIGDRLLAQMPLIRPIYSASKQLLAALTRTDNNSFQGVALIEYPRKGVYAVCFISQRVMIEIDGNSEEYCTCFVPSTPTPVSGMTSVVPAREVIPINMTVEEGVKFLVSGGVASLKLIKNKAANPIVTEGGTRR